MRATRAVLLTLLLLTLSVVGTTGQSPTAPTMQETSPPGRTYTVTPFEHPGTDACWFDDPVCLAVCDTTYLGTPGLDASPAAGCPMPHPDDSIRVAWFVPEGWVTAGPTVYSPTGYSPPGGQAVHLMRGGWMFTHPCVTQAQWDVGEGFPDIVVGPTVDDFVDALGEQPAWEATAPIDATLGGWSGKYLDIQLTADFEGCMFYPWANGYYAQGPDERWHIWALDVDGIRVVVLTHDFEGTPEEDLAAKLAVVQSITIEP